MTPEELHEQIETIKTGESVEYIWAPGCTLTAQQQADIVASQINNRWDTRIPSYLERCDQLRADNPSWSIGTVRAVAKAGE